MAEINSEWEEFDASEPQAAAAAVMEDGVLEIHPKLSD